MCFVIPPIVAGIAAGVSAAAGAVGAGVSIAGAVQGADAQRKAGESSAQAAEFQAAQGRRNAAMAERAAVDTEARGNVDANKVRAQGRQVGAAQRVGLAASNIEGSSGSALALQEQTAAMSELDAQTVKNNAAREAWGYRSQGAEFNSQAYQSDKQAQYERDAGDSRAIGSLLGGFGQAAGMAASAASYWAGRGGTSTGPGVGLKHVDAVAARAQLRK